MHYYHYKWSDIIKNNELSFAVFWKLYNAIDVIMIEEKIEVDVPYTLAIQSGEWNYLEKELEKSRIRIPYIRTKEAKEKDAKNARLQMKHMNRIIKERKAETKRIKNGS